MSTASSRPAGPRVVAVEHRPGDALLSAGGVLALLADAGADVRVVTCAPGDGDDAGGNDVGGRDAAGRDAAGRDTGVAAALATLAPSAPGGGIRAEPVPVEATATGLARVLAGPLAEADAVLAPMAVGAGDGRRLVTRVVGGMVDPEILVWWRDVPAVLDDPGAPEAPDLEGRLVAVGVGAVLERKVAAARLLSGRGEVADALAALARAEGARLGRDGPDEVLRAAPSPGLTLLRLDRGAAEPLAPLGD